MICERLDPAGWAATQIGVRESTGNNDGIPFGVDVREGREDYQPWCADFVLDAALLTGCPIHDSRIQAWRFRSVRALREHLEDVGAFCGRRVPPMRNDLYFLDHRGQSDSGANGAHVGIVESVDWRRRKVTTIDGNWGNKVARREFSLDNRRLVGFGRFWLDGVRAW